MNYWLKEAERKGDELSDYSDWIDSNEDYIIEQYVDRLVDFPEDIYEGVLDDDYEQAQNSYCENLKIENIPDDFIQNRYQNYLENGEEERKMKQSITKIMKWIIISSLFTLMGVIIYTTITCNMLVPFNTCKNGLLLFNTVKISIFIFTISLLIWLPLSVCDN